VDGRLGRRTAPFHPDPGVVRKLAAQINGLRAERAHLYAQVRAGNDTTRATKDEANERLWIVERELADAENDVRNNHPDLHYLIRKKSVRSSPSRGGRASRPPTSEQQPTSQPDQSGGTNMASKSKTVQLEETLVALRKAEKSAGSTKWALSGKGAEKNPPSAERKAHLEAKLATEQALVTELREKRAALTPAPKAQKAEKVTA
jgi:predicted  nucleic acid-binding Zn-ribbon protein